MLTIEGASTLRNWINATSGHFGDARGSGGRNKRVLREVARTWTHHDRGNAHTNLLGPMGCQLNAHKRPEKTGSALIVGDYWGGFLGGGSLGAGLAGVTSVRVNFAASPRPL